MQLRRRQKPVPRKPGPIYKLVDFGKYLISTPPLKFKRKQDHHYAQALKKLPYTYVYDLQLHIRIGQVQFQQLCNQTKIQIRCSAMKAYEKAVIHLVMMMNKFLWQKVDNRVFADHCAKFLPRNASSIEQYMQWKDFWIPHQCFIPPPFSRDAEQEQEDIETIQGIVNRYHIPRSVLVSRKLEASKSPPPNIFQEQPLLLTEPIQAHKHQTEASQTPPQTLLQTQSPLLLTNSSMNFDLEKIEKEWQNNRILRDQLLHQSNRLNNVVPKAKKKLQSRLESTDKGQRLEQVQKIHRMKLRQQKKDTAKIEKTQNYLQEKAVKLENTYQQVDQQLKKYIQ